MNLESQARDLAIKLGQTAIGFVDIDGVFLDVNKATPLLAGALAACVLEGFSHPPQGGLLSYLAEHAIVLELKPATSKMAGDEIRLERRDGFNGRRWAVTQRGYVLNKGGEWEFEPIPSSRTEEWLQTTRWDTMEEAIEAAERAAQAKTEGK